MVLKSLISLICHQRRIFYAHVAYQRNLNWLLDFSRTLRLALIALYELLLVLQSAVEELLLEGLHVHVLLVIVSRGVLKS